MGSEVIIILRNLLLRGVCLPKVLWKSLYMNVSNLEGIQR